MTFDARADVVAVLDLVSIDTEDGVFRFIVGTDGLFRDIDGNEWLGSRLITGGDMRASIQGEAPSGSLTLAFIPDPDAADLISEIRDLGSDYVAGREVIFWEQPLLSVEEFFAPTLAAERIFTRRATSIDFDLSGAMDRSITLNFEGPNQGLNTAPGWQYTTADHQRRFSITDTSLRHMPTTTYQVNKVWG